MNNLNESNHIIILIRALLQYTQQRHLLKLSNFLYSFYSNIEIEQYFLSMIRNIHFKRIGKPMLKLSMVL
jgi:hypothetical protein